MAKKPCREKRSYYSEEEAFHLGHPNQKNYLCPHCGKWHQTSGKTNNRKWRKK